MILLIWGTQNRQVRVDRNIIVEVLRDQAEGNGKLLFNAYTFPVWDNENVPGMGSNDGYTML